MDTAETVWKLDQVMGELRQAIAKLELAKGEVVAGHYQAMADEAAAQNPPRTEPAEASEVKAGESIVHDGRVRKVLSIDDWGGRVGLYFEDGSDYFDARALVDLVVDTKLADEAANRAGLARTWAALRGPAAGFDDAQAAHLAAGLAELGLEPR